MAYQGRFTISHVQKLPAETKLEIASYCTPSMLTSLALVASGLRHEAEKELYYSIAFNADRIQNLQRAFETLATNPQKAQYVRFLTVEAMAIDRRINKQIGLVNTRIAAQALLAVLPKLVSLTDLRVKFHPDCTDETLQKEFKYVEK
ncbi:hypothetical protein H0H92_006067 [Tricholoma furcatifolium]|nr:hypothetical protein H0H92_006067 [Tricholoma furcatifolium]